MPVGFVRRIFAGMSQPSASNVQAFIRTVRSSQCRSLSLIFSVLLLGMALSVDAGAQTAHFSYAQVTVGSGFSGPFGVAVDGSGNVFVSDVGNDAVYEILSAGGYTTVNTLGSGFSAPYGVAVDGSGNVYVADWGNRAVKEILSTGGYTTVNTLGSGFSNPAGVAVDGSGNVFVADLGVAKEILSAGGYTTVNTLASGFGAAGVAVDGSGNVFVTDDYNKLVKEILSAGGSTIVKTVASGFSNFSPHGVAVDGSGNIFVVDTGNNAVKEILSAGGYTTIKTVGSGFNYPWGVAVDGSGNVFVGESRRVVKLETAGADFGTVALGQASAVISLTFTFNSSGTIGNPVTLTQGTAGLDFATANTGTCTAGTSYSVGNTCTVDVSFTPKFAGLRSGAVVLQDGSGNTIATGYVHGVGSGPQMAFGPGIISTAAGKPALGAGYSGDNGPAISAQLSNPAGVALDGAGNLYIADLLNQVIRKVTQGGSITTVAGNGAYGYSGDKGSATSAQLYNPAGVALDGAGNLYIADLLNNVIRKVTPGGTITTVAGNNAAGQGYSGDNGPAISAQLRNPQGVALDGAGNLYIADTNNNVIREVTPDGIITTVAGNNAAGQGYSGDSGPASSAQLNLPSGVALDGFGNLYIADYYNNVIRKVTPDGTITTAAGSGSYGYSGDSGPASAAQLGNPFGVALDGAGNVYIADLDNGVIRKVTPSGMITTVAGVYPLRTYGGDGGSATSAQLGLPEGVALDGIGNLYIVDAVNNVVRKVDVSDPPSLTFASSNVGQASASQDVAVQNIGNAPLNISQISTAANFSLGGSGTTCSSTSQTLAAAASCILGIEFNPTANGSINGSVILTDNALNVSGATQQIQLLGTGIATTVSTVTTVSANPASPVSRQPVTLTATISWTQSAGPAPGGTVTFNNGATLLGTSALTQISSTTAQASWNPYSYQLAAGSNSIQATYSGDPNYLNSSGSLNLTVAAYANATAITTFDLGDTATVQTAFHSALTAEVVDAYNNPVPGVTVTFTAPATGASATLSAATVVTDNSGMASVTATANAIAGSYVVSASISGSSVNFYRANLTGNAQSFGTVAVGSNNTVNLTYVFLGAASNLGLQFGVEFAGSGGLSNCSPWPPITLMTGPGGGGGGGSSSYLCNVSVTFQPQYPGQRVDAVVVTDFFGDVLQTTLLSGIGQGPQIAFGPGTITTYAGNGQGGYSGEGGAAIGVELSTPNGVAVDGAGNLYIADTANNLIRKVTPGGTIATVAGNGGPLAVGSNSGYSGDGGPASAALLNYPHGIAVDGAGNLYIADSNNNVIRKVTPGGTITTVAGGYGGYSGDGGPATSARLNSPYGVAVDGAGNLYIADSGNNVIREVTPGGTITTIAGNYSLGGGYSGDNGLATSAQLYTPYDVAMDASGNLYIADSTNSVIRRLTPSGTITTVAGNYSLGGGYSGDNGPAISAQLGYPHGLALDGAGNLYVADLGNVIRKVMPGGAITTVAGNGIPGYSGDKGPATTAQFTQTNGVAVDGAGNLYIADTANNVIRKVDISDAPSLTFASTSIGASSAAQDVTVLNLGNAPLSISQISPSSANFSFGGADTSCSTSSQTLNPAASCVLGVQFNPMATRSISGSVVLADNNLNVAGATQQVSLSGTGVQTAAQVTVGTTPAGLSFSVDGTSHTTSQTLTWVVGSSHTLTTAAQSGADTQYSFLGWSDGTKVLTDSVIASTGATAYTAQFNASAYLLNVSSSNSAYGTVTAPAASGGYNTAGAQVMLTGVANAGYYFSGWTGSADIASTSNASTTITVNGPETVTANFAPIPSYVVTTALDDTTGTASNCPSPSNCSLRDALAAATAAGAGNITFSPSAFPSATTIQLTGGLNIPSNTTITGLTTGSGTTLTNLVTISGGGSSSNYTVFTVNSGVTGAAIANLIIANGYSNAPAYTGGGIFNAGTLTVNNSVLSNNSCLGGGGIRNASGTLTVSNSTFSGNGGNGGGIRNDGGTLTVTSSIFSGNFGQGGGGIYVAAGTATVSNSTFSGNYINLDFGGGILNDGTLTVSNSTFSGNYANNGVGGGIMNRGTLTLSNSIVAGNTATNQHADLFNYGSSSSYTDNGGNQASNNSSPTSTIAINLAPLGNYGGPTQTMPPLPGSPAICAGLAANIPSGVTTDQRGYPNTNTTYPGYSSSSPCVDAGAVQSNYSLNFTTQPSPISPVTAILPNTNFQAAVTLAESGSAFTAASESIPLTLTGTGTLSNATASTASGVASYSTLQVSAAGTGDTLTASLAVTGSASVSATSSTFNVTTVTSVTVMLGSLNQTYTGSPLSATATTIPAGLAVTFTYNGSPTPPTAAGSYTVVGTITSSGYQGSATGTLAISKATPTVTTWLSAGPITYGQMLAASQLTGGTASVTGSFAFAGPTTAPGVGIYSASVTFMPMDSTDYNTVTGSVNVAVNKATPTVSFTGAPASAPYHATFTVVANTSASTTASITASGSCTIVGTMVTISASTGTCSLNAAWAADNNYLAASAVQSTIATIATKPTPTITWATPAAITYGTALSGTQLNAKATYNGASVAGSFVYTPGTGTVLGVGTQTLSVVFTPRSTTTYSAATASVNLQVNPATPRITWARPAAITYGTALSSTQLNATASVPGSFAYSPAAGTVLGGGSQTLSVTFTPTDTTDYTTAKASVTLRVNWATPTLTSITPNVGVRGTAVSVTLTGTNFTSTGTTVAMSGTGVTISGITVVNSTTITATFTLATLATSGTRSVNVTTQGGASNAVSFTVQGTTLTSVTPNTGARGTSVQVTLTGSNLTGASAVTVSGTGVTVSGVSVVNATAVTATFTINAGATPSAKTVRITTPIGTTNAVTFSVN